MISCQGKDEVDLETNTIDYLIIRDNNQWRKRRIARLILSSSNRSKTLRRHYYDEKANRMSPRYFVVSVATIIIKQLVKTDLGSWILRKAGLM
jgi:hypothetical protein